MANVEVQNVGIIYPDIAAADVGTLLDGIYTTATSPVNVQVSPGVSAGTYNVVVSTSQFVGSIVDVVAGLQAYDALT